MNKYQYAAFIHDRDTEDDPRTASIIYSSDGGFFWHQMAVCPTDYAEDLIVGLEAAQREKRNENEKDTEMLLLHEVIDALCNGPLRGLPQERRERMKDKEWAVVLNALDILDNFYKI